MISSEDESTQEFADRLARLDIRGDWIAMVPHRDGLFLAKNNDVACLEETFALALQSLQAGVRHLCPLPLKLEHGQWGDWIPPQESELRSFYENMNLYYMSQLYASQKKLFEDIRRDDAEAPYVAPFEAIKMPGDGKPWSCTLWASGLKSLLPRAGYIDFFADDEVKASGSWERVAEVVGGLMVPDETLYPIRYRVCEFPSEEQLAAIGPGRKATIDDDK